MSTAASRSGMLHPSSYAAGTPRRAALRTTISRNAGVREFFYATRSRANLSTSGEYSDGSPSGRVAKRGCAQA